MNTENGYSTFKRLVVDKLKVLEVGGTYSIKEGWLATYVDDVRDGRGVTFPLVCASYLSDSYETKAQNVDAIATRSIQVEAAIEIGDDVETVNHRMDTVRFDLMNALSHPNLTVTSCAFKMAKGGERFAGVQINLNITFNEKWGEYDY